VTGSVRSKQFALFRVVFGAYLFVHFSLLIPHAEEIFGRQGVLPDPSWNATAGLFPNPLHFVDTGLRLQGVLVALALLSAVLASGIGRPLAALLLWLGWACLFHRNNLISNPSLAYVGWLLLACALIPRGEPALLRRSVPAHWQVPVPLILGGWGILAAGYTLSGIDKFLDAPSWRNGDALTFVLEGPLARANVLVDGFLASPFWVRAGATWFSLAAEILFLPLAFFARTRWVAWSAMVAVHLGILVTVDFPDLTLGMLVFHLFLWDSRWVSMPLPATRERSIRRA
jgi:hypothetical protein